MLSSQILDPSPADVAASRAVVEHHLDAAGVDGDRTSRILLVLSELATNAVMHGCGADVVVVVELDEHGAVTLTVDQACDGSSLPPQDSWTLPVSPMAIGGRGLAIVAALADEIHTNADDHHTSVRVTFR